MCLNPITIRTNSDLLDINGSVMYRQVPCGHCAECRAARANAFFSRAYYEGKYTIENGGYFYMDTLTYNDDNIHYFHNIQCFDYNDISKFFKRLRTYFNNKFDNLNKDAIKYLCCGEFGEQTHRPHYHVGFYINDPRITVDELWQAIREKWTYGFNNPKEGKYAYRNYYITNIEQNSPMLAYLSKYTTKGSSYDDVIYRLLESELKQDSNYSEKMLRDEFKKHFRCIYRASTNFGLYALKNVPNDLLEQGKLVVPDKYTVKKYVNMPLYLKHKLFYNIEKTDKGYRYVLNEKGIQMRINTLPDTLTETTKRYQTLIDNLPTYCDDILTVEDCQNAITRLLDERNLYDFTIYRTIYKGCLLPSFDELPDMYDMFYNKLMQTNPTIKNIKEGDKYLLDQFTNHISKHVITENSFEEFNDFDKLDGLFYNLMQIVNIGKQRRMTQLEKSQNKLKLFIEKLNF